MRALANAIVPSWWTSTIGSGAVSRMALSFSSAFLRSEMSRMMPLKKRAPAVSHIASESSSGNSRPSLRRPTTSTVWPISREAAMPPSATRLMPASCIGRKRSGIRIESALPRTSSSV